MSEIFIGENGNWFIDGVDTGKPSRGQEGKSAYDISVDFGYQGTMTDWLKDLKGEAGITPHIGNNGNWFIGNEDTDILADTQKYIDEKFSELSAKITEIIKLFPYKEYIKVDIGEMPNNTTKAINLPDEVNNLNNWNIIGCWAHTSYGLYPIPFQSQEHPIDNVEMYLYKSENGTLQAKIKTYTNWTGYKGEILLGRVK